MVVTTPVSISIRPPPEGHADVHVGHAWDTPTVTTPERNSGHGPEWTGGVSVVQGKRVWGAHPQQRVLQGTLSHPRARPKQSDHLRFPV